MEIAVRLQMVEWLLVIFKEFSAIRQNTRASTLDIQTYSYVHTSIEMEDGF